MTVGPKAVAEAAAFSSTTRPSSRRRPPSAASWRCSALSATELRHLDAVAELRLHLQGLDLLPDRSNYERERERIEEAGRRLRHDLSARLGRRTWEKGLRDVSPTPTDDTTRVLGFGVALTEFLIAPLQLNGGAQDAVVRLGALANLIVTVYDSFVDSGNDAEELLPSDWLVAAARGGGRLSARLYAINPSARLLARLVRLYFAELYRLPHARRHVHVSQSVVRAIQRMYEAERATLRSLDCRTLRQKSALPFVVMAVPGWLARPEAAPAASFRHLLWSWRVGAFFGSVDDVVDLAADASSNRPNLIREQLKRRSLETITQGVAADGATILSDWREALGVTEGSAMARGAFGACLASWLGGAKAHAI